MFRFHRSLPNISIFHDPASPQSKQALALLRAAVSAAYPPSTQPPRPLEFNLEVVEHPPTPDQLTTIRSYARPISPRSSEQQSLHDTTLRYTKFPIVVNWDDGQAAIDDVDGVKGILESLRRKRDGEEKPADEVPPPKGWFS